MFRFLRAFAWLRWRLMLNAVRGARRRDTLEQVSRMLALVVPAALVAMSAGAIVALSILGALGGHGLATGRFVPDVVILVARALLGLVTGLVVLMPIGAAAQKGGTTYTRLLLLPIPARALHLVEVMAGVADPWLLMILPGLGLFAISMAVGGRADMAGVVLLGAIALVFVLVCLGALTGFLVSWLFRDRRRAELLTVVFMLVIGVVALLPQLINTSKSHTQDAIRPPEPVTIERVDRALPAWTLVLPSEMFGHVIVSATDRRPQAAAGWLVAMLAEAAVCFWLSGLVYGRLMQAAGGSSSRRGRASSPVPWRLPGLGPVASAVAWAQVRSGLRSVRGRLAVLLPGPMPTLLALVLLRSPEKASWISTLSTNGYLVFGAGLVLALYAVQPFTLNQFASDRSGLTQQFLLPVSGRELVRGKAYGGGIMFVVAALVAGLAAALGLGGGSPVDWIAIALGGLATYAILTPAFGAMSALFPVAADMSKPGSGGNPHPASMFIGTFLVPLAAVPAALIVAARLWSYLGPWGGLAAMAIWLMIAVGVAWPLLNLVAPTVNARRENLFLTISKR